LKKVMLLAAMLAMVLAAAVPALGQNTSIAACVQTAVNQEIGNAQVAVSQYGDATNINIQAISQQCNVTVAQVNTVVGSMPSATTPTGAQYQYNAPAAAQYQYSSPAASASSSASASPTAQLPSTGGSSLIALGAGVLLVAGGLLARRIVR
jgi:LPXTG-motif cell wall-anchored protein